MMASSNNAQGGRPGPGIAAPEPSPLALELQRLSASTDPEELARVETALTGDEPLLQLNTADQYSQLPASELAVYPILAGLARNGVADALNIVSVLATDGTYLAEPGRAEALLAVLPRLPAQTPATKQFLRDALDPESDYPDAAVEAVFEIGEPDVLALFAEQVCNPDQDDELVSQWLRDPLLRHRTDPAVIRMSIDLLDSPRLGDRRKNALVEAMVDYRPRDWYLTPEQDDVDLPTPPPMEAVTPEARALLEEFLSRVSAEPAILESVRERARQYSRRL